MQPPYGSGFQPPPMGYQPPRPPPSIPSEAIIAIGCGFIAMSTTCFPFGFVALYYGKKARDIARERGDTGATATLGLVGMIMGGVFGALWLVFWVFELLMILFGFGLVGFALFFA